MTPTVPLPYAPPQIPTYESQAHSQGSSNSLRRSQYGSQFTPLPVMRTPSSLNQAAISTQLPDDVVVDVDVAAAKQQTIPQSTQRDKEEAAEAARWRQKTETVLEQLSCKIELIYSKLQELPPPPPPPAPPVAHVKPPAAREPSAAELEFQSKMTENIGRIEDEIQKIRREAKRIKRSVLESTDAIMKLPLAAAAAAPPPPAVPVQDNNTQVDMNAIVDVIQHNMEEIVGTSERRLQKDISIMETRVLDNLKKISATTTSLSQTSARLRSPRILVQPARLVAPSPAQKAGRNKINKPHSMTPKTREVAQFRKDLFNRMLQEE